MKPLVASLIFIAAAHCFVCNAQCPSNRGQLEVTVSYGMVTGSQVAVQFSNSDNSGNKTITGNSGAEFLSVRYFLFNRLALGFSGGVTNEKGQYPDRTNPVLISSTYQESFTTVALELYYIYYFRKRLEIYTLAGFGPSFTSTETTSFLYAISPVTTTVKADKIAAQYTPFGVRVGGRLAGFVELGIGYKGIINGGLSYKFGSPCWWRQ